MVHYTKPIKEMTRQEHLEMSEAIIKDSETSSVIRRIHEMRIANNHAEFFPEKSAAGGKTLLQQYNELAPRARAAFVALHGIDGIIANVPAPEQPPGKTLMQEYRESKGAARQALIEKYGIDNIWLNRREPPKR